jgi:sensor histidine kinase regulating citrate/malate metabolism
MIPKKQNNDDYVDINDEDSVEASIDVNNISHIFDLLSNMYRDNYGSIVREISSNCFDAHRDAGLDDDEPIVISKKYDDTYNSYICFRDFGKGMSPEFMKTTYMSYGKSTKKETNNQLGMYGYPIAHYNRNVIN